MCPFAHGAEDAAMSRLLVAECGHDTRRRPGYLLLWPAVTTPPWLHEA